MTRATTHRQIYHNVSIPMGNLIRNLCDDMNEHMSSDVYKKIRSKIFYKINDGINFRVKHPLKEHIENSIIVI